MTTTFLKDCKEVATSYAAFQSAFKRLRPQFDGVPENEVVRLAQEISKSVSPPQLAEKRGPGRPRKELALLPVNLAPLRTFELAPLDIAKEPARKPFFVSMDKTATKILRVVRIKFSDCEFTASDVAEFLRYKRTQTLVMTFRALVSNGFVEIVTPRGTGTTNVYRLIAKGKLGPPWPRLCGFA